MGSEMTRLSTCWGMEEKRKEKNKGFNDLQLRREDRRKEEESEGLGNKQFKASIKIINYITGFFNSFFSVKDRFWVTLAQQKGSDCNSLKTKWVVFLITMPNCSKI